MSTHFTSLWWWSRRGRQSPVFAVDPVQVTAASCAGAKDSVAPDVQYPSFREEMVCSLLETLISHPRAVAASKLSPAYADAQFMSSFALPHRPL